MWLRKIFVLLSNCYWSQFESSRSDCWTVAYDPKVAHPIYYESYALTVGHLAAQGMMDKCWMGEEAQVCFVCMRHTKHFWTQGRVLKRRLPSSHVPCKTYQFRAAYHGHLSPPPPWGGRSETESISGELVWCWSESFSSTIKEGYS